VTVDIAGHQHRGSAQAVVADKGGVRVVITLDR
jgi:hypothetical protein